MLTKEFEQQKERFQSNHPVRVGIVGLGYVGLPLLIGCHKNGYHVVGVDVDQSKIDSLNRGVSYLKTLKNEEVQPLVASGRFKASSDFSVLKDVDVCILAVPTPLTINREPDMGFVRRAVEAFSPFLRKGQLISLESTVYPGATRDVVQPVLEATGLKAGKDFYLVYSPEREDPGNVSFDMTSIPKVVGADDPHSLELGLAIYGRIVPKVVGVSSTSCAEAVKLTENIFRCVNIAMINELKFVFDRMGINIWEVIEAAKTKPFGFMPFYPGPGVGGHCIPVDPFYLSWKAREYGVPTRFVELSGEVIAYLPEYVIHRLIEELDVRFRKSLRDSSILILGLSYKKNLDDIRESPSCKIFSKLLQRGVSVAYHDPIVPKISHCHEHPDLEGLSSVPLDAKAIKSYDAIVLCADHDAIDTAWIAQHAKLLVDTRNATKNIQDRHNIVYA